MKDVERVTLRAGAIVVADVDAHSPGESPEDWQNTALCIPAMGYIISDGVLFIRGKENTWVWMWCENVHCVVSDSHMPDLLDQLNTIWQLAVGN